MEDIVKELKEEFTKDISKSFLALAEHLIEDKNYDALKEVLSAANELAIIDTMNHLCTEEQVIVYRLLSKDKALRVFEQLDISDQQRLINSFTEDAAIEIIEELDPDERVRLFDEMPAAFVKRMLAALSPKEREMTNLLMGFKAQTAGHIMTPEYVRVSRNLSVAEALEKTKIHVREKEMIYTIYVTDDARKLEGVIPLRDLWIAEPSAKVGDIMQEVTAQVSTDTDQEEVARLLQLLDWLAIPVVDNENRLVGVVTIDDAIDILEEEATEDILDSAGFADADSETDRSEVLINGSLWKIWKVRLPFLLATMGLGMVSGLVIDGFEETLEAMIGVAIFIPLIMGMGGNIGTQSSTVFARGLVLGHIQIKNFAKPFLKEVGIGLSIGLLVGVISGFVATFWLGIPMLGLAVGLAMTITMTIAAMLGFLVPYVLVRLKADQAAGSAPIITTLKDLVALLIYFACISLFMGHLM